MIHRNDQPQLPRAYRGLAHDVPLGIPVSDFPGTKRLVQLATDFSENLARDEACGARVETSQQLVNDETHPPSSSENHYNMT